LVRIATISRNGAQTQDHAAPKTATYSQNAGETQIDSRGFAGCAAAYLKARGKGRDRCRGQLERSRVGVARRTSPFFRSVFRELHRSDALLDADGIILRANQAALAFLGYTRNEYVGRNIAAFHEEPASAADMLARLTHGDNVVKLPVRLRWFDPTCPDKVQPLSFWTAGSPRFTASARTPPPRQTRRLWRAKAHGACSCSMRSGKA
jgi:hypothetical protein